MEFNFETKVVESFLGDCLIIKDKSTGKHVELMRVQAKSILRAWDNDSNVGGFPHASFFIENDTVHIQHDGDEEHEINIGRLDLTNILNNGKGVNVSGTVVGSNDLV